MKRRRRRCGWLGVLWLWLGLLTTPHFALAQPLVSENEIVVAGADGVRAWSLPHGAYTSRRFANAVVLLPPGWSSSASLDVVVFLHGWNGCASALMSSAPVRCRPRGRPLRGWGLGAQAMAGSRSMVFVIPQLAFLARDGSAGRWRERGAFAAFMRELRARLSEEAPDDLSERWGDVHLVAHSAGFESALAIVQRGEAPSVRSVVLFDALYRGGRAFLNWVESEPDRRLVIFHARRGRPAMQTARLWTSARRRFEPEVRHRNPVDVPGSIRSARIVVVESAARHGEIPEVHLAEVIRALVSPQE